MVLTPNEARPATGEVQRPVDQGKPDKGFLGYAAAMLVAVVLIVFVAVLAGGFIGSRSERSVATMEGADTASADRTGALFEVEADTPFVQLESASGAPNLVIYFEAGREEAGVDFASAVAPIQEYAAANPNSRFEIVGFEDETVEGDTANPLAERRASAIAEAMANTGIAAERIGTRIAGPDSGTLRSGDNTGRVEIRTIEE
jgi:outer membrane protein OmpA-like peptidoglycan-associated protein